jgi:hypothetical protein
MERGFYNEDIEELLKEKADQYKMYPSDKVWKGIHRSLHPNRKWYWFSLVLFLGAVGYYTFIEFITPSTANKTINGNNSSSTLSKPTDVTAQPKAVIVPFGTPNKQTGANSTTNNKQRTFILNPDKNDDDKAVVVNMHEPVTLNNITPEDNAHALALNNETAVYDIETGRLKKAWQIAPADHLPMIAHDEATSAPQAPAAAAASLPPGIAVDAGQLGSNTQNDQEDSKRIDWVQNLAVYELQVPKLNRLSWQIAFTPTMNYRTLKGTSSSDIKVLPLAPSITGDLNKFVNHKPALGFELGSNLLYSVNKSLTLKTGFQFNYIRYDIQAYSSYAFEQATIALNNNFGIVTNEITSYTRYRNFGGDAVENLRNQFFQLSLPVGLELNLFGNHRLQVGIAGTLQPTYLLNRNTYLITADYKYTTEPSLVRKWNLNSTAEAFVSYKTGDLKWQVGPQFRYQLLSNYVKEYPIREHLMEYGIRIGVAKTIR